MADAGGGIELRLLFGVMAPNIVFGEEWLERAAAGYAELKAVSMSGEDQVDAAEGYGVV